MPTLPAIDLKSGVILSPHVVILGAGASAATCPNGDRNKIKLPVMRDFTNNRQRPSLATRPNPQISARPALKPTPLCRSDAERGSEVKNLFSRSPDDAGPR
jgi:hypothetical protein